MTRTMMQPALPAGRGGAREIALPSRLAPRRRAAFSLVELTMVMAIIAIVAGIAIPRYGRAIASYRASAAARRVMADLAFAQMSARGASTSVSVVFTTGPAGGYEIAGVRDIENGTSTYRVSLAVEPYNARIASVTATPTVNGAKSVAALASGDSAQLTFDGYGVGDSDVTIVVQSAGQSRTVHFDPASGRCSLQ